MAETGGVAETRKDEVSLPGPPRWGRVRLPRTFASMRHTNFRLFYFGQLVSLTGAWMQNTAQGWLVVLLAAAPGVAGAALAPAAGGHAGGEATANLYLGIIAAAGSLPVLFGALYGGMVADRNSKRRVIVLTQTAQMGLALAMAVLIFQGDVQIAHVVGMALLSGVINAFDIPARQAFVVEMVGKEDLPNAIALNASIFNAARALGPAATGLLISSLHAQGELRALALCFLFNGLSFAAVIWGLLLMRGDFAPKTRSAGAPWEQVREVVAYLKEWRAALLLVALVATFSIFVVPYHILLPSLARFTLRVDARGFGLLMSCQGLGALLGALTMATLAEYEHKGRILTGASLVFPGLMILLALSRVFAVSCGLAIVIGFLLISFISTANAVLQTSTPDHLRGRMMGVYSLILMGLTPVGSLWAGAVARAFGAPAAISLGAVVAGTVALIITVRYPRFRRMGRTVPERL